MTLTSINLLEKLRGPNDPAAWKRFVTIYTPFLYEAFTKRGLQHEDATDLVQEVFTKLLKIMPTFQYNPEMRFRGFLYRIANNMFLSARNRWADRVFRKGYADPAYLQKPDPLEEVSEAEFRSYLYAQAMRIVQRDFEEKTWKAVWETVIEERPAAEVAKELEMNSTAVYAAKIRVMRRLQEELQALLE